MKFIDSFLDSITMYRLVLYYLLFILGGALVLSATHLLPFSPLALFFSIVFITAVCFLSNRIFARTFKASANIESSYITALILACIIAPPQQETIFFFLSITFWASLLAMASKYIFAWKASHIFNPAAVGIFLTSSVLGQSANWWIGNLHMFPLVFFAGLFLVRKLRRFDLVFSFLAVELCLATSLTFLSHGTISGLYEKAFLYSPLFFFAFIMLTEPLTMPREKKWRIAYAALVGVFFAPQFHLLGFYFTPEAALLIGNVFSFIVSPKQRLKVILKEKIKLAPDIFDFLFSSNERLEFSPGQYLEWTLPHEKPDTRGNRRYFTVASSPEEEHLRIGVKFYNSGSSFKESLLALPVGSELSAGSLAGDFILPKDTKEKLIFIAGGIGITPFRSILKALLEKKEKRQIILFYSNKKPEDIVYKEILEEAERALGIKTVYTITDRGIPEDAWRGKRGYIDTKLIQEEALNWKESIFYLSGPHAMVTTFEKTLKEMGIKRRNIKKDFFPGFA